MSTVRVARKAVTIVVGWLVVALGVALLALPVPGSLIILLGLAILATEQEWAASTVRWIPKLRCFARSLVARAWRRRPTVGGPPDAS